MTFHTKAATDEIYSIFNQPLDDVAQQNEDLGEDTADDDYDDCTSGGESTGTGLIESRGTSRAASEVGDDDEIKGATEWSDFTTSKHNPLHSDVEDTSVSSHEIEGLRILTDNIATVSLSENLITPTSPKPDPSQVRTKFVPIPPEDYEPPARSGRENAKSSQNRLPFMTPIVERTESSLGMSAHNTQNERRSFAAAKTPSRSNGSRQSTLPGINDDDLMSSPFQEMIDYTAIDQDEVSQSPLLKLENTRTSTIPTKAQVPVRGTGVSKEVAPKGPIIKEAQCNPTDSDIRKLILENLQPPISSYNGYFYRKDQTSGRSAEIRKFAKIAEKKCGDKTTTSIFMPPILRFEGIDREYTVKKELGKGAFAPVYLVENTCMDDGPESENEPVIMGKGKFGLERRKLEAIKMENPPTAWEFYIMRQAKRRLGVSRAADSVIHAYEMHLFADEGFLIEEYRDQGTLLDLVNIAKTDTAGSGVMDEALVIFFTIELFRTVEALHTKGILHGDLKADNCLVRFSTSADSEWSPKYRRDGAAGWQNQGLALIDFGRGIDMKSFTPTVQFIADWKTGAQDCAEIREMRPWTYQIDYHGLAGIVHSMLFGKYIDTVADQGSRIGGGATKTYRIQSPLKRYWQQDIWNAVFDLLLNPLHHVEKEEKGVLPIVKSMRLVREEMEEWLEGNCERGAGLKNVIRRMEGAIRERIRPGGR
jgi:checkpoint serine/threonine-protein kinase